MSPIGGSFTGYRAVVVYQGGPGDIVASNWVQWGGLRAFSAAMAVAGTQTLCRLRRGGDNVEADFLVATSGGVGLSANASDAGASNGLTPAAFSTFGSGSGALFVTTLYDQTGTGNHLIQTANANQPQFILSGLGGLPVMRFVAATPLYLVRATITSGPNTAQPFTWTAVAKRTGNITTANDILSATGNIQFGWNNTADSGFVYTGVVQTYTLTDNTWHGICASFAGAASNVQVDATATSVNPGLGAPFDTLTFGMYHANANQLEGDAMECGLSVADLSSNAAALNSQAKAYYGY